MAGCHSVRGMPRLSRVFLAVSAAMACVAIQAADDVPRLPDVVVTATGAERDIRDVPAAASVVHKEDIEAAGAENVLDAVRDTPGAGLLGQSVGGRKTLSLRGMDGKHTLFMVDGLRVIHTDDWVGHSDLQYDWAPIDGVERIEVVRGPMSVLYGSEAMGGVVNVITARPSAQWQGGYRLNGRVADGAADGGDSISGGVHLSGGLTDTLRLAVSASTQHKDALKLKEDPRLSEMEGKDVAAGHVHLSWQPAADHLIDLEHRITGEERWRDRLSGSTVYRDSYDIDRTQSVLAWNADWSGAKSRLRTWNSDFDVKNRRTSGIAPTRPQSMNEVGVDGRVAFGLGAAQFVTLGVEQRKETMKNAGLVPNGEDDATFKAVYVQDEIGLGDDLLLTLGVRHDDHSIFGGETSPRAYLVWHATPQWSLRGGYGEGFRAPTLKQASPNYEGAEGPHTFYGNADIKPETSASWELGVVYAGARVDWEATAFHNDVTDLITTRQINQIGPRRYYIYDNINKARIQGVETALKWQLPAGFHLGANAQWLDTENTLTGQKLNGRPELLANLRLGWKGGPWDAALRLEHTGKQNIADLPAPAYELLHASVSYDLNRHLKLTGGIDNLTNLRLADESDRYNYSESPRTLRLGLKGTF